MHCPFCSTDETKVIDSRLVAEGAQVRRRRECLSCTERFTTYEAAELVLPRIIKQDGSREPFDEEKLRACIDSGSRPGGVYVSMLKKKAEELRAEGKDPNEHKRPEGGLEGRHTLKRTPEYNTRHVLWRILSVSRLYFDAC